MTPTSKKRVFRTSLSLFFASMLTLASGSVLASTQPYITSHQINFGTGNKYLTATDVSLPGPGPRISFTRTYNSQSSETSVMGYGWTASLTEKLIISTDITLVQSGGRYVHFTDDGSGQWINETGSRRVITAVSGGYQLAEKGGTLKQFDSNGVLLSKTDRNNNSTTYSYSGGELVSISNSFGKTLSFSYASGKLSTVTSSQGTVSFSYDSNDNLETVTKPDTTTITYIYDDANDVNNLTGITDEESTRILTVEYDTSDRVTRSIKADGANEVTIAYPANYMREVTNSLGVKTTYHLDVLHGIIKVGSFTGPGCSSCGSSSDTAYVYNNRLQVTQKTDGNGIITGYTYDTEGNRLTTTEAVGTSEQRVTTKTYTIDDRVETITKASASNQGQESITTLGYDTKGNMLTRTEAGYSEITPISRATSYTYNSYGQVTFINGPRTDVNDTLTLSYYANDTGQGDNRGQLHTVTNSLGHVTTYSNYTIYGQAETITDANGLVTSRSYNSNGRLGTSTTGGLVTSYTYSTTGDLITTTLPGSRVITYGYTPNGQIDSVTDNQGNSISYSYDTEGRRTGEEVRDPSNSLTRFVNFEYNDAGRMTKVLLPVSAEQTSDYDTIGNLVTTINATGMQTDYGYDALNRLLTITEPGSTTSYGYDSHNNITTVTDADSKITSFTYDDFGRRLTRNAPDTNLTSYSYNPAGNLLSLTDANSQTVSFDYDALNRPTRQYYGSTDIFFTYDQNPNGTGRLSSITDEEGSRSFLYNSLGLATSETRVLGATSYTTNYVWSNTNGELNSMSYPAGGSTVSFVRGTDGNISSVSLDGSTLINAIRRLPFGPLKSAEIAGSITLTKDYDQRYNVEKIQAMLLDYTYTRDAEGHVTSISNVPAPTVTDETTDYTYNTTNNQLTASTGTAPKTYSYDTNGNITTDGVHTFTYDELNRITQVEKDSSVIAIYGYDASNRRVRKAAGGVTTHYHYDLNSQLIAETLVDGTLLREYIYLSGEPLALKEYQNNPGTYYFINDHLGTPQQLIDGSGTIVWKAAYLPFGEAQVVTESVVNNLRFPGQYFDAETGLHYNWHRFYDPTTGRYITADPIGLAGGMNLYAYVGGNPVNAIDITGLDTFVQNRRLGGHETRSRANLLTHTFVFTTDQNGNVEHTYSWGNEYDPDGGGLWRRDQDEDILAAINGLQDGTAEEICDDRCDPSIEQAFNQLFDSPVSTHWWTPLDQCKTEKDRLVDRANRLRRGLPLPPTIMPPDQEFISDE